MTHFFFFWFSFNHVILTSCSSLFASVQNTHACLPPPVLLSLFFLLPSVFLLFAPTSVRHTSVLLSIPNTHSSFVQLFSCCTPCSSPPASPHHIPRRQQSPHHHQMQLPPPLHLTTIPSSASLFLCSQPNLQINNHNWHGHACENKGRGGSREPGKKKEERKIKKE